MLNTVGVVRTVKSFGLETTTLPDGQGGTYDFNQILFVVASKRNKKETVYDEYGKAKIDPVTNKPIKDYRDDFILVKATGALAKLIDSNVISYRMENGEQKINSRFLYITGTLETYKKVELIDISQPIEIDKMLSIDGKNVKVKFQETMLLRQEFPHMKTIIELESFQFLDSKPVEQTVSAVTNNPVTVEVVPDEAAVVVVNAANVSLPPAPMTGVPEQMVPQVVTPAPAPQSNGVPPVPAELFSQLSENMPYQVFAPGVGLVTINGMIYTAKLTADGKVNTCPF